MGVAISKQTVSSDSGNTYKCGYVSHSSSTRRSVVGIGGHMMTAMTRTIVWVPRSETAFSPKPFTTKSAVNASA